MKINVDERIGDLSADNLGGGRFVIRDRVSGWKLATVEFSDEAMPQLMSMDGSEFYARDLAERFAGEAGGLFYRWRAESE